MYIIMQALKTELADRESGHVFSSGMRRNKTKNDHRFRDGHPEMQTVHKCLLLLRFVYDLERPAPLTQAYIRPIPHP